MIRPKVAAIILGPSNMHSKPFFLLSILAMCVFTLKFSMSLLRLCQGMICARSILESALCFLLFIASILLFIFSIRFTGNALEALLPFMGRFMIIYQCTILWQCYDNPHSRWARRIRWIPVALQTLCTVLVLVFSALIAANKGHTKAWKITTLSFFTAEYASLDFLYLWKFYKLEPSRKDVCQGVLCIGRVNPSNIFSRALVCFRCIFLWNILSCSIAWALATTSLCLFLSGRANYLVSLWIDIWAAVTWTIYWLLMQCRASFRAFNTGSNGPGSNQFVPSQQCSGDSQRTILSGSDSSRTLGHMDGIPKAQEHGVELYQSHIENSSELLKLDLDRSQSSQLEVCEVDRRTEVEVPFTPPLKTCHGSGGPSDVEAAQLFPKAGDGGTSLGVFDIESYRLVRLSAKKHCERRGIPEKLNKEISACQVCSVIELPDESWELLVPELYLTELVTTLNKMFPSCYIDQDYNPCEPSKDDARRFGHDIAKSLSNHWFSERAREMIKCAGPEAAAYYTCCMERLYGAQWRKILKL